MLLSSGSSAELRGHEKDVSKVGAFPCFFFKGELFFFCLPWVSVCLCVFVLFLVSFPAVGGCGLVEWLWCLPSTHMNTSTPTFPPHPFLPTT